MLYPVPEVETVPSGLRTLLKAWALGWIGKS